MPMEFNAFDIDGPVLFVPNRHRDARGVFAEIFRNDEFRDAVGEVDLVQENQSISQPINTLRGLHYQTAPYAQGKLVRVTQGAIMDVAVDIRPHSATFGRHIKIELSSDNWYQLWIPEGFAHGFKTLRPDTHVMYKASNYYSPDHERGILWNDPDLRIDWELYGQQPVLSKKDLDLKRFIDTQAYVSAGMPTSSGFQQIDSFI
ncbi:dTDP-4-dehydrorhamnose 3,5-epimerase [Thalassospira lucentensis]|uniref:dTDP-4-dehydrorhamnose 3,5-epimerase n=1 Tax=Thalassospira lucentensis TaxID=168935 RepID=UPI003D2F0703